MEGLRDFLRSWKGKVVLAICLSPMALLGVQGFFQSQNNPNDIAKIGNKTLDNATFQNMLSSRLETLTQKLGDASLINQSVLKDQVLQSLVDRTLLENQLDKLGMTVSDEVIIAALQTDPAFLDDKQQFSNDLFARYLQSQHLTKDQLFATVRSQIALAQFNRNIVNTAIYPMSGVTSLLTLQTEQRPVWLARLPWQSFASQVSVSDKEIDDYFAAHQADMQSKTRLDLAYVIVDKSQLSVPAVTEAELNQQYQTYVASQKNNVHYDVAMILVDDNVQNQALLSDIKNQLDSKKADFATLAKQYSQDEGSKNDGGNIGTISEQLFPKDYPAVLAAVKALKVGEVTPPIKTQYGYQLFKLNKIDGLTPPSLASVRTTMLQQAMDNKRELAYQTLIKQMNQQAASGAKLADIAAKQHLIVKTLPNYPKDNNTTILNQPSVIAAAFDDNLIKTGSTSIGVDLKGRTVWLQPSNYSPAKAMTLAEARSDIRSQLTQQKAKALALTQASTIAEQVQKANTPEITGLPSGVKFVSLGTVSRQATSLSPEEKAAAFSQPASGDKLAVTTTLTEQGASVLVGGMIQNTALNTITPKQKNGAARTLRENLGQSEFQDYLAYLHSVTEVKIKPIPKN